MRLFDDITMVVSAGDGRVKHIGERRNSEIPLCGRWFVWPVVDKNLTRDFPLCKNCERIIYANLKKAIGK